MTHRVTFIPGDGTGPEIAEATKRVLDATGVDFDWDVQEAGVDIMETAGTPLPDAVIESIKRNSVAIKGPITTPVGHGFRSVNVALRKALDLYACVRPCKSYDGVRSKYDGIDLVFVRENTEDLYAGIEFEKDTSEELALAGKIEELSPGVHIREHSGISIKPISVEGTKRVVRFAFEYAVENDRSKVTAVHKANIMKHTDGLWLAVATEVAEGVPGHRVRGADRRQHVHAARAEARAVRRDRPPEPLRRHPQRPGRRPGRRPRRRAGREHRRRGGPVRAHPRQRAEVRRHEQGRTRSR